MNDNILYINNVINDDDIFNDDDNSNGNRMPNMGGGRQQVECATQ